MCSRSYDDTVMDVQNLEISNLGLSTCDPLPPFGLFGACTTIWILSGLRQKGVFSLFYGISSDYLGDLGFLRFALNCSLLSVHAASGCREVNYSFHGVAMFASLC
uniref:Putative ovule protein n=1 Tax=Solanum chacoense TaxID=4108 RepID=A0A0V0GU32_SOLCH